MREHQMLRSGPLSDVAKSTLPRREDERQGALDLDPIPETALERIERRAYDNAKLSMQLAQADTAPAPSNTYRAYNPVHGWVDKVDVIAAQAAGFSHQLANVKAMRTTGEPDDTDAEAVNANIAMVAREADDLITALIKDAEAHDLEATGKWMSVPLVDLQEFETPMRDDEV